LRHLRPRLIVWLVTLLVAAASTAEAQYFGRNKVQYRSFEFEILKTEHFDLYFYPEEADAAQIAARMAERWYSRLSRFFGHELRGRQTIILYAVPAHFRQTNAVEGLIGEGTGGLTEAIKRRVVLPMSGSLADTDHVLGHELVHAFQFDLTGDDPRESMASMPDILQYPLWFVEGMAEYLTLGAVDSQTSMWLRDAALREKLPHIRDLDKPEYFPYRWGHAFWAFVGAKYGDRAAASLLRSAANPRYDLPGMARQLGTDPDTLTADWHRAIREATSAVAASAGPISSEPRLAIGQHNGGGRFNIGPRVSPDGKEVAFFSERGRFSVELFVADVETGRVKRKLSESATDPHFDSLEFLSSAGAWSPDGRTLAVAAVRRGRPVLAMLDPKSGRIQREVALDGLDDAHNPAFAPDGRTIVMSGNRGGLIDLYRVSLDSGAVTQLTRDAFADLQPTFTPDGESVVFVTERFSTDLETLVPGPLRLARLTLATGDVRPISAFLRGKHLSPQVSADGTSITFIADPDGVNNLYRLPIDGGPILRLSSFVTGVAGITSSSPALSATADGRRFAFSVFENDGHAIHILDEDEIVEVVAPEALSQAALLPGRATPAGDVQRLITDFGRGLPAVSFSSPAEPYRNRLTLDAIGQPTVTAGVSEFGGYIGGSMSAFFTDMLGDRLMGVAAQAGGSLADVGGQLVYLNRKHRWSWGGVIEWMPYRGGYLTLKDDEAAGEVLLTEVIERQTNRGGSFQAAFPLSTATRLEVSGGLRSLTFTQESRIRVYSAETRDLIDRRVERATIADPLHLAEVGAALVHDTSHFGATSPIFGARSRFELAQSTGSLQFTTLLADWRRYYMPVRPVTIAVRGLHMGRYGEDSQHRQLVSLYAGYPELVHGYGFGSFSAADCTETNEAGRCQVFGNLLGSRLVVANAEVRAPLVGLFTGDIEYGRVPVEVAAFMDAGIAWTRESLPAFMGGNRHWVRSVGAAARLNVFGFMVLEIAASHPLDRVNRGIKWQIGIRPGF